MKLAKPEFIKSAIFLAALLIVLLVFDLPMSKNIKSIYAGLSVEKANLEKEQQAGHFFEQSYQSYQDLSQLVPSYADLFKAEGAELNLITKLEDLASANDLEQHLDLSFQRTVFSPAVNLLGLKINLKGKFADLTEYLAALKKMNFEIAAEAVDVTQIGVDLLEANLLTNTFWLKP